MLKCCLHSLSEYLCYTKAVTGRAEARRFVSGTDTSEIDFLCFGFISIGVFETRQLDQICFYHLFDIQFSKNRGIYRINTARWRHKQMTLFALNQLSVTFKYF